MDDGYVSRGLVLFSGGLDSILAALVLREQGSYVEGIVFASPFFGDGQARKSAKSIDLVLNSVDFSDEILSLVEHPRHGFGGALNPCIDCHAGMIKKAGVYARENGFDYIATGEVLNQRPMSQNRRSLSIVAAECNVEDMLVRPLSAKLLEETPVEKKGLLKRDALLAIEGRSRKEQMELAKRFGLEDYPSSGGGCLLTEKLFANKLGFLRAGGMLRDSAEIEMLKIGRHFVLPGGAKAVVGRNSAENERLRAIAGELDYHVIRPIGVPGPTTVLKLSATAEDLAQAKRLCAAYSDKTPSPVRIRDFVRGKLVSEEKTEPAERELCRGWLL